MVIRGGRRTRRGQGRGCRDPPQPSQLCTSPALPPHASTSRGVENDKNRMQRKQELVKGADAFKNKQKIVGDYNEGEDEEMQLIWDKISHFISSNPYLNAEIRGRGAKRGRGRGCHDPPQPSRLCTSPALPLHASTSRGVEIENGKNRLQEKQGLVKGDDVLKNKQKIIGDYNEAEAEEMQLIWDKISHFSSKPRTRRGRGRGCRDPQQPSQSCISPTLSPTPHASPSQGIRNDKNKMQQQGLVKVMDALKNKQKNIGFCYEENNGNDDYADDDDGDEVQLTREQINQQEVIDANNTKKGIGTIFGVSSNEKGSSASSDSVPHSPDQPAKDPTPQPLSGVSCVEKDRRNVISVEAISNPRRFVPQSVTRDIISTVFMRMPAPAEKWKSYPSKTKDELFKDFMGKYQFASDYDHRMARMVWERTCLDRYPDTLKNARKMALKRANSTNLADTKGHGPKGMKAEIWDGLVDIWLKPEWKKKSVANRSNRAVLVDSMLHTGGSIRFGEHKRRMETELKHEVSYRDVYDRLHRKKDGDYISKRSKALIESYDSLMSKKYGEDRSMHPVVDSEVWAEVAGPQKKRAFRDHGLDIGIRGSMTATSSEHIGPSNTVAQTQEVVKEAVNIAMTSFVQSQLMPLLEPILLHLQSMHDDD